MSSLPRLVPLDAFRGLTIMLMIIVNTPGSFEHSYAWVEHAPWIGCTLADLVFPFFLFSTGLSGFLSNRKYGNILTQPAQNKLLKRTLLLFLLGILYNMFPFYNVKAGFSLASIGEAWSHVRVLGVLQRIALASCLGIMLGLKLKTAKRLICAALVLLIIHTTGLYLYAPAAPFAKGHNLSQAIDWIIPGTKYIYQEFGMPFDPEGLYGTISSAASVLVGYLAGYWLTVEDITLKRLRTLRSWGAVCMLAGLLLHASTLIPICKALWTASYVFLTSGLALLLVSIAMLFWNKYPFLRKLYQPWQAFGTNPIFFYFFSAYVALSLAFPWFSIQGKPPYEWLFKQLLPYFSVEGASLVFACCFACFCWLVAEILYKKGIIIKI